MAPAVDNETHFRQIGADGAKISGSFAAALAVWHPRPNSVRKPDHRHARQACGRFLELADEICAFHRRRRQSSRASPRYARLVGSGNRQAWPRPERFRRALSEDGCKRRTRWNIFEKICKTDCHRRQKKRRSGMMPSFFFSKTSPSILIRPNKSWRWDNRNGTGRLHSKAMRKNATKVCRHFSSQRIPITG